MKPFTAAPRTLVILLGFTIFFELVQVLVFAPSLVALLFPALVTTLALSALYGSRRAAITIKYLFYFLCVALLLSLGATRTMSVLLVSRRLASAALYLVVARFIGVSADVAEFYGIKPAGHSLNELVENKMNPVDKFKQQKKCRIIATITAITFIIPSMIIKYNKEAMMPLPINPQLFALILQAIGLVFLVIAYLYSKCPVCSKCAGNGWSITTCRNCGEKLS